MFTWGTGNFGELGISNIRSSNNPIQINMIKKFFIYKIQCGNNFTAGLDCNNFLKKIILINIFIYYYNFTHRSRKYILFRNNFNKSRSLEKFNKSS